MAFVNRDFNAAINIRRYTLLKKRPDELTRASFVEHSLKTELY
jgi:transposase